MDLNETKTKKVAETITSDTSRKILNYLTEKEDSEANIAKGVGKPISTVHYHLQKLQEAGLVIVEEFHYSKKGREINHYKLANKYIIIAPKKVAGLKEKLRGILPVGLVLLGISAVIKFVQRTSGVALEKGEEVIAAAPMMAESADVGVRALENEMMMDAAPSAAQAMVEEMPVVVSQPDIALWFFLGGVSVIVLYVLWQWFRSTR